MNQKITCACVLCLICQTCLWIPLLCNSTESSSGEYPVPLDAKTIALLKGCETNLETEELCMRCAKITKSTTVYPECCGNLEGVKDWCYSYVYYRVQDA